MKEFRNNLLKRKEVEFFVDAEKNPGIAEMQKQCANHFKVETDTVVVKKLWSNFGSQRFFAEAFVYDSVGDKENGEPKPKVKKEAKK
ncbi:MAG: hypothetical protein Q7S27_02685 [Nanoarchaeota archaeon]|nr:hypothetical protein [Nanoarchaeota archaeon]